MPSDEPDRSDPVLALRREELLAAQDRLLTAMEGLMVAAEGIATEVHVFRQSLADGGSVTEALGNLSGFRVMLSTAVSEAIDARDFSRAAFFRLGLAEGLTVERLATAYRVPVDYVERILRDE